MRARLRGIAVVTLVVACVGMSMALAAPRLVAPELVGRGVLQDQLSLRQVDKLQLSASISGPELAWQELLGDQGKDRPLQYVRAWLRTDGTGGAQILGQRGIDLEHVGIELNWPQITYAPATFDGQSLEVPHRAEGKRERWLLAVNPKRSGAHAIGCDLGPEGNFTQRRVTWTAEFHEWRYEPLSGTGDFSRPADHRFLVMYAVVDLKTNSKVSPKGQPVEITPTCSLGRRTPQGVFLLYRVAAFWQGAYKQYVHVPAYAGTSYWGPPASKDQREPHLFAWLFPDSEYQVVLCFVVGIDGGYDPMTTSELLRARILGAHAKESTISYFSPADFGHSTPGVVGGPVWQCGLSPATARIDPDGTITPLDTFASTMHLWVSGVRPDLDKPKTLDEAVSWDEELMWTGGARIAYMGVIHGELPPDQVVFYQRWVQRMHDLGYKTAVGWDCVEVSPTDYTYKHHRDLVALGPDGKDVPCIVPGYHGVMLDWLNEGWQKWATGVADQLLSTCGFDYLCFNWAPMDQVDNQYLLAPVDGTMPDVARRTSLSTGNPWYFTWLSQKYPGRLFHFGDTEARAFSSYTAAPVGRAFFSWDRVMTQGAGWGGSETPTKAVAFERWCQIAAMRMAYVGAPSLWGDPSVTGVSCYLGQEGMKVLRRYSDIVSRLEKECWGLCMDLPVTATDGASPHVRVFLPRAWSRGRLYVMVGSDKDTTVTINLPMVTGRYMVCDLASGQIWSTQGPLTVKVDHESNLLYPEGGLRPLLIQELR